MQCFVEVEYIDDMGRETVALLKRKGKSQVDIMNKVARDFFSLFKGNVAGIDQPNHLTVSHDGKYPEYCYGDIVGRDRIRGTIRTLSRNDNGHFSEQEYRLDVERSSGKGSVEITDWKYWG